MQRKQFLRYMGAALGWVAVAPLLTACGGDDDSTTATTDTPVTPDTTLPPATSTLSAEEIAGLKFMREEEKLAHDVYIALYALYGNDDIFYRISLSETTHTEAILALLVKYGIPDPAAGKPAGVFEDPALQALYDTLIAMGSASQVAALKVGALDRGNRHPRHQREKSRDRRGRHPDGLQQPAVRLPGSPARLQQPVAGAGRDLRAAGNHAGPCGI